jgi:hypothetical protein
MSVQLFRRFDVKAVELFIKIQNIFIKLKNLKNLHQQQIIFIYSNLNLFSNFYLFF